MEVQENAVEMQEKTPTGRVRTRPLGSVVATFPTRVTEAVYRRIIEVAVLHQVPLYTAVDIIFMECAKAQAVAQEAQAKLQEAEAKITALERQCAQWKAQFSALQDQADARPRTFSLEKARQEVWGLGIKRGRSVVEELYNRGFRLTRA